ncbi:MAG: hypothetical protein AB1Z29_26220 [Desulfobacterales bacterium]
MKQILIFDFSVVVVSISPSLSVACTSVAVYSDQRSPAKRGPGAFQGPYSYSQLAGGR